MDERKHEADYNIGFINLLRYFSRYVFCTDYTTLFHISHANRVYFHLQIECVRVYVYVYI